MANTKVFNDLVSNLLPMINDKKWEKKNYPIIRYKTLNSTTENTTNLIITALSNYYQCGETTLQINNLISLNPPTHLADEALFYSIYSNSCDLGTAE